jgi:hypothetical protein
LPWHKLGKAIFAHHFHMHKNIWLAFTFAHKAKAPALPRPPVLHHARPLRRRVADGKDAQEHVVAHIVAQVAAKDAVVVRIPVGYWIADAPVGGSSPLEYGISPEGFVTGGLNYLRTMLGRLRDRGISAMIDIHSLPCNSHCVSDGLNCKTPLAYTPDAKVSDIEKCEGGLYPTSRPREKANGQPNTWGDVGLESTAKIANWIASLPEEERATVVGLQLANEPALNTGGFNEAIQSYYSAAVSTARSALPASTPLIMSFLYPNDWGVPTFIKGLVDGGAGKRTPHRCSAGSTDSPGSYPGSQWRKLPPGTCQKSHQR